MAWNYAELSKMEKANGGLEKSNYDSIKAKGNSDIIVKKFSGNKKEHIDLLLLADDSDGR